MGNLGKAYCVAKQGAKAAPVLKEYIEAQRKRFPKEHGCSVLNCETQRIWGFRAGPDGLGWKGGKSTRETADTSPLTVKDGYGERHHRHRPS
jgi:hypothetical protein